MAADAALSEERAWSLMDSFNRVQLQCRKAAVCSSPCLLLCAPANGYICHSILNSAKKAAEEPEGDK